MSVLNKIKRKGIINSILYVVCTFFYKIVRKIACILFSNLGINDKYIVFSSEPDFSDNAKKLYEYYISNEKYKDYKYIWLVKDKKRFKDTNNTIFLKSDARYHKNQPLKALYYLNISRMIYFTHSAHFELLKKKKNQIIINLWHGCGYKNIQANKKKYIETHPFDYALVPGKVFIDTKSSFWGCKKEQILTIGYPRYDLLKENNNTTIKYVNNLRKNNKLVLWMPTFRNTGNGYYPEEKIKRNFDMPLLDSKEELEILNNLCKKTNVILCIKRHPRQLKYSCENKTYSNIIFIDNNTLVKENIDLYSLLKYTDGLITDYSSVAIDYLLLNKPIAFTLDDYEEYSKSRGFVFKDPKKYMPGHHIYNFEDMQKYVEDIGNNKDLYKEDRQAIMNEVHNPCDNYCERIVNKIEEIMEEKNEKNTKKN